MKHEKLLGIQLARGIAALLVVFYHAGRMIALPQYAGHKGMGGAFDFGHAGVDFFFVLSGFIIYFVHHSDLGHSRNLARYLWRRVTRIYPSYWLITAFVIALMLAKHDPALTFFHAAKSILLIPDRQEPLLGVAWTLLHEIMFYAVFAVAIFNIRAGIVCAQLWIGIIAAGLFYHFDDPILKTAAMLFNFNFLIGIAAAYMVLNVKIRLPLAYLLAGAAVFLATGLCENAGLLNPESVSEILLFGGASGLIIVGAAIAERDGQFGVGRIGEFFGGASYLLYLVHTIVVGFVFRFLMMAGVIKSWPDWICVLLSAIAAILVVGLLYVFYERPVLKILHRVGEKRPALTRRPA
jgi:peptidoglycan/LPS O-acetylase OafA/YrhL